MYIHSVPVPRLYKIAAKILREVKENGGSLKQLLYTNKHTNVKGIYALIVETLKHFSQIDIIIEKSELLVKENRFNPWLARIFITELLWNEKPLPGESKPIQTIMSYYDELKKHKLNLESNADRKITKKVEKPRFVRINTLLTTLEEVINGFREEDWKLIPSASTTYEEYLSKTNCLGPDEFMIDLHIKELLLFPCNTEFYRHYAYKNGLIILQDKASCLPARLLNPPPGSTILDMCAAPGMKTTHLAALLNNEGIVYAVERDAKRFKILNQIVETAGATCVKTINKDVLQITADDCANVEYILVDPSCSGSGIANRIEINDEDTTADPVRLKSLTHFQTKILKHAFTSFPQAKRIVYSTCSVYPEENENVVRKVQDVSNFKLISAKNLLNGPWKSSDSEHDDVTDKCLFTKPEEDLTNGFFVAVFERQESAVEDPNQLVETEKNLSMVAVQKNKKVKKNKHVFEEGSDPLVKDSVDEPSLKRKRDKAKSTDNDVNISDEGCGNESVAPKKKKKKSKKESKEEMVISESSTGNNQETVECNEEITVSVHKKHKKKNKQKEEEEIVEDKAEKKKKKKSEAALEFISNNQKCEEKPKKSKKHKKAKNDELN